MMKPKTDVIYSVQVWLASALIGPVLFFLPTAFNDHTLLDFFEFYWLSVIMGLLFSFVCFFFLWAGVSYANDHSWGLLSKRLFVAGWAMALAIFPFWLIYKWMEPRLGPSNFFLVGSYLAPLWWAIFYFRWPQRKAV